MEIKYDNEIYKIKEYENFVVITDPENDFMVIPKKVIKAINLMI